MKNIILDNLQIIKKWTLKNEVELKKILEKIQQQEQKIKDLKSNQFQKKDKDDSNFINQFYKFKSDLSPNIGLDNDNFEQKGSRYKRQKIFKIDNAKINLVENLYDLVYNSLDNKNLVDEYFEMIN